MDKFPRGTVVHHKVMGKGIAINNTDKEKVEVRMANGQIEKFYPEELETEDEVIAQWRRQSEEANRANRNRIDELDPY